MSLMLVSSLLTRCLNCYIFSVKAALSDSASVRFGGCVSLVSALLAVAGNLLVTDRRGHCSDRHSLIKLLI